MMQKPERLLKPWHVDTHLKVLSESFPMNTNMTGFRRFQKLLRPCASDESSLSTGRVNTNYSMVIVTALVTSSNNKCSCIYHFSLTFARTATCQNIINFLSMEWEKRSGQRWRREYPFHAHLCRSNLPLWAEG